MLWACRKGGAPQGHPCNMTFPLWCSEAGSSRLIYSGSLSLCCSPSGREPLCSSWQHTTHRYIKTRLLQKQEQVLTECALKTRLCPRFVANKAFLKYKPVGKIGPSTEMITEHLPSGVEAAKAVLAKAQDLLLISAKPVMPWRPFMCLFNIAITLVSLQVKAKGLLH